MSSDGARRLGSANTFWRTREGTIEGTETDGEGFLRALGEAFDLPARGLRVAVLGAGGAGRAVAAALAEAGAATLYLWNRTGARAERLAVTLREMGHGGEVALLEDGPLGPRLPAGATVDLLVNATSLGLGAADPSPADPAGFPGVDYAMDLVYGRQPSAFLRAFDAAGARTADGRAMLLHQGARAFELWFDSAAPLEVMRSALDDALRRARLRHPAARPTRSGRGGYACAALRGAPCAARRDACRPFSLARLRGRRSMPSSAVRWAASVLAVFFPPLCLLCDEPLAGGERPEVCGRCRASFRAPGPAGCGRCGAPVGSPSPVPRPAKVPACLSASVPPPGRREACRHCEAWEALTQARAALLFAGQVRGWMHRLKYGGVTGLAGVAADPLERAFRDAPDEWRNAAALVPVPLHPVRRRERGFNQSELLAVELSRRIGLPVQPLLCRRHPTARQVGLAAADRRRNVNGAFEVRAELGALCRGRCLVLVDDVLTTGATLDAAARALAAAGAGPVLGLAAARALPGSDA